MSSLHFEPARIVVAYDEAQLEIIPVVAATIPSRLGSQVMRTLNSRLPMPTLKHLKRIRQSERAGPSTDQLDVLICHLPASSTPSVQLDSLKRQGVAMKSYAESALFENGCDVEPATATSSSSSSSSLQQLTQGSLPVAAVQLLQEHDLQTFIVSVPSTPPSTRDQWVRWSAVWPTNWRVAEGSAGAAAPNLAALQKDQTYFERWMKHAWQLAAASSSHNAAVLVDPVTGQIVACGADKTSSHPLHHCVMVAIQSAAACDWRLITSTPACAPAATSSHVATNDLAASAVTDGDLDVVTAKRQRTESNAEAVTDVPDTGKGLTQLVSLPAVSSAGRALPRPYMCTGYDCFVVCEPCVMCAMALVHSRVAKVIYSTVDTDFGALGGNFKLHSKKSLNHHYQVYHMPLAADAAMHSQRPPQGTGTVF